MIQTVRFDAEGNVILPKGVVDVYDMGLACSPSGIVKSMVTNTRVDMSTYRQSVFADTVDAVQALKDSCQYANW